MATRFTEKLDRSLRLLMGLRHLEVREALALRGLTDEAVTRGWALLTEAGMSRLEGMPLLRPDTKAENVDPLAELESFQDRWFPVARATLLANYPAIGQAFSLVLVRERRSAIPFAVGAFLDRLEAIERGDAMHGADGPAARALLEQRGLTKAIEEDARQALAAWGKPPDKLRDEESAIAAEEAAAAALWAFYLEWSSIASSSLKNPAHLRWLGLAPARAKPGASKRTKADPQRILALPSGTDLPTSRSLPVVPAGRP